MQSPKKLHLSEPSFVRTYVMISFDDLDIFWKLRKHLVTKWGEVDYETESLNGKKWESSYGVLQKWVRILSFSRLVKREKLVQMRQQALDVECYHNKKYNISMELLPGYVTEYTVVQSALAEDFHRIYLYGGVYAETLYHFTKQSFQPFEHSQAFFRSKSLISIFNDIRLIYMS